LVKIRLDDAHRFDSFFNVMHANNLRALHGGDHRTAQAAGLKKERLLLDPGFGFGKNLSHNYELLAHLSDFHHHVSLTSCTRIICAPCMAAITAQLRLPVRRCAGPTFNG
jgi:hypothetical protein